MKMHKLPLFKTWSSVIALFFLACFAFSAQAATARKTPSQGVVKIAINAGVSLDEAAESMRLRAHSLNMKLVAELPLSSQVEAITGKTQRRVTIFQFCDALTAKDLIDLNVDFAVYMPCRIALVEDAKGQGWLVMMDIDVDAVAHQMRVSAPLKKRIQEVRATLINIMQAGANGEL
jgi:uncharacterized protein (DUF302 family)